MFWNQIKKFIYNSNLFIINSIRKYIFLFFHSCENILLCTPVVFYLNSDYITVKVCFKYLYMHIQKTGQKGFKLILRIRNSYKLWKFQELQYCCTRWYFNDGKVNIFLVTINNIYLNSTYEFKNFLINSFITTTTAIFCF